MAGAEGDWLRMLADIRYYLRERGGQGPAKERWIEADDMFEYLAKWNMPNGRARMEIKSQAFWRRERNKQRVSKQSAESCSMLPSSTDEGADMAQPREYQPVIYDDDGGRAVVTYDQRPTFGNAGETGIAAPQPADPDEVVAVVPVTPTTWPATVTETVMTITGPETLQQATPVNPDGSVTIPGVTKIIDGPAIAVGAEDAESLDQSTRGSDPVIPDTAVPSKP